MSGLTSEGKQNFLLRQAREERRLSQTQVAETIGVDGRTYRRWENEGHIPSWYAQRKLLAFFGKSTPDELGFRKSTRRISFPPQLAQRAGSGEAGQESISLSESSHIRLLAQQEVPGETGQEGISSHRNIAS